MAEGDLDEVVRAYARTLGESGIDVDGVIIAGTRGASPYLDCEIDVLVVSASFGEDPFADSRAVMSAAWKTDARLMPVPVHPDRWADADDDPRLSWAKRNGRSVSLR